jgi:hypothetical protein
MGIEVLMRWGEVLSMRNLVMTEEIEKKWGCQHSRGCIELDWVGEAVKHVGFEFGLRRD